MGRFYNTDPDDPDAPVQLDEYHGYKPADRVTYYNPESPDSPLDDGPLVVDEIYRFDDGPPPWTTWVVAILNGGKWEVNADHLTKHVAPAGRTPAGGTAWPHPTRPNMILTWTGNGAPLAIHERTDSARGSVVGGRLSLLGDTRYPNLTAAQAAVDTYHQHRAWDCEAYGPPAADVGALCFVSDRYQRVCGSRDECHQAMTEARRRLLDRIRELAEQGDETAIYLRGEFTRPEQLLGGDDTEPAGE